MPAASTEPRAAAAGLFPEPDTEPFWAATATTG